MALAFAAMNTVFGRMFTVDAEELFDPAAVDQKTLKTFIFDIQTHHVAMPEQAPHADQEFLRAVVGMRDNAARMNPGAEGSARPPSRMPTWKTTSRKCSSTATPTWWR